MQLQEKIEMRVAFLETIGSQDPNNITLDDLLSGLSSLLSRQVEPDEINEMFYQHEADDLVFDRCANCSALRSMACLHSVLAIADAEQKKIHLYEI